MGTKVFAKQLSLSVLAVSLLAACGGSSNNDSQNQQEVLIPISAANDSAVTINDDVIYIDVLENDSAGSAGALTLISVSTPQYGQAEISGNEIRYSPPANFLGSDEFSYTVSNGTGTATAHVSVAGHQSVTLSGRVIDSPIANASVSVSINGNTHSTVADSQGYYELPVVLTSSTDNTLVRLTAQGAAEHGQQHITLSSRLVTADELLALRQDTAVLDRSKLAGTQVTQITTARDILLLMLSDESITSDNISLLELQLDVEKLLQIAGVIKLIIDEAAYSLPADIPTLESFLLNAPALQEFIDEVSVGGDDSPLVQAITETLADPEITPAAQLPAGRFLRVLDTPEFMSPVTLYNISFDGYSIKFQDRSDHELLAPVEKPIQVAGSVIEVIDPLQDGVWSFISHRRVESLTDDQQLLTLWYDYGCPGQVQVHSRTGFKKFTVVEQTTDSFIAQVERFTRGTPQSCAGLELPIIENESNVIARYVRESHYAAAYTFDLELSSQWVLPDIHGRRFLNDVFTLHGNGSVTSMSGIYSNRQLSWNLSEDKKTLELTSSNHHPYDEIYKMELVIDRKLDFAFNALVRFSNTTNAGTFGELKSILPVYGDGVLEVVTATKDTNQLLLSSVNTRAKEWSGRERKAGNWFGWKLSVEGTSYTPRFRCDDEPAEQMLPEAVCSGNFVTTETKMNPGHWHTDGQKLFIERGLEEFYASGHCTYGQVCNLRVIVPLFEKDGIVTGYEYNQVSSALGTTWGYSDRNNLMIMPRVMHWSLQELPPQQD